MRLVNSTFRSTQHYVLHLTHTLVFSELYIYTLLYLCGSSVTFLWLQDCVVDGHEEFRRCGLDHLE